MTKHVHPDDCVPCLACAGSIGPDDRTYPDVEGTMCAQCAPTYADLLGDDAPFIDMDTGEPLSAAERRSLYDAHIAAGGKPTDSMAR